MHSAGEGGFNGAVNTTFDYTGLIGDLVMAVGSVDQTGTYVLAVEPQATRPEGKRQAFWQANNVATTMVTLWNPDAQAHDYRLTFYYPGGQYQRDIRLTGRASTMIDVARLIAAQEPHGNGHVIPPTATDGIVAFTSATEEARAPLVIAGGTLNVTAATCGEICVQCCPVNNYRVTPSSFSCVVGEYRYLAAEATDCEGYTLGLTYSSTWDSTATNVATVSNGTVNCVGAGGVTIGAQQELAYTTGYCYGGGSDPGCPLSPRSYDATGQVTCATPTNFQQSSVTPLTGGGLRFTYTWASTTGTQSHLSACTVGESVFYPNYPNTPYIWPLPMVASTTNPTVLSGAGSNSVMVDNNLPPDGYQQPYSATSFNATQRLWWSCPCYQNGNTQYFVPDITIARQVFRDTDNLWKYRITKSGSTNTATLPNQ